MILQSLHALYQRLKDDPAYEIAPPGYSLQKITFKVVLRPDGTLVDIQDARHEGRPRQVRVLGMTKSSGSGLNPCFLWDNMNYVLGYRPKDDNPERTRDSFKAFKKRHLILEKDINSPAFSAVCRFLETWSPKRAKEYPLLSELSTGFGVFQIAGKPSYVHDDSKIDMWWRRRWQEQIENPGVAPLEGQCLITGRIGPIARLHQPMIKGVKGGQAQAALVGFNDPAYESYGKESSYNSPVSEDAAFQYCTALNALLDGPMRRKHRLMIGDSTVVFWTDRPSLAEDIFARFAQSDYVTEVAEPAQDETLREKLEIFLRALRMGSQKYADVDHSADRTRFYLLALSPNAARLSVRFFFQSTIRELLDNLRCHYQDMAIERRFGDTAKKPDPEFPPLWMLLRQTARDSKDVPAVLSGPLLRAVMTGGKYPDGLYAAVIRRIRADSEDKINYVRACILKAWLVRNKKRRSR